MSQEDTPFSARILSRQSNELFTYLDDLLLLLKPNPELHLDDQIQRLVKTVLNLERLLHFFSLLIIFHHSIFRRSTTLIVSRNNFLEWLRRIWRVEFLQRNWWPIFRGLFLQFLLDWSKSLFQTSSDSAFEILEDLVEKISMIQEVKNIVGKIKTLKRGLPIKIIFQISFQVLKYWRFSKSKRWKRTNWWKCFWQSRSKSRKGC